MKVSIIIRCLNEEKHIGRLLAGILEQDHDQVEIIVVDSGSSDATLSIASRFPTRVIHIKPEEFSFGFALNKGCEAATGEILLFASAHVYPIFKDWLTQMLSPFSDEKVALVYGKQQGDERGKTQLLHEGSFSVCAIGMIAGTRTDDPAAAATHIVPRGHLTDRDSDLACA